MSEKKKPRRIFWRVTARAGPALAGGLVFWLTLPDVTWLVKTNPTETAMMGFRSEQAKLKGLRARRLWRRVSLSRISPYLIQAVLIAEDDKFFAHEGFDWESMRGALESNIGRKRGSARRLDHHPAAGQEPVPQFRAEHLAQAARGGHRLETGKRAEQEAHPGAVPQCHRLGHRHLRRRGRGAFLLRLPGRSAALSQAIRLASILPNPHRFSALGTDNARMNRKRRIIAGRMLRRHWIRQRNLRPGDGRDGDITSRMAIGVRVRHKV